MNRIDFALVMTAVRCNPNGDPTDGGMPRQDFEGYGVMSDVCIKRKIRNRLMDFGENILVASNDRVTNGLYSIKDRVKNSSFYKDIPAKNGGGFLIEKACKEWIDVRSFGQIFAYSGDTKKGGGVSRGIRGPVTVGEAVSLEPIDRIFRQITKSTNAEADPDKTDAFTKDSSTMGYRYIIDKGAYVSYGSIYPNQAYKTGFTEIDAKKIKQAMTTIFEGDYAVARPAGSMTSTLYWWEHKSPLGNLSPATVHRSLHIEPLEQFPYFKCNPDALRGITLDISGEFA